MKISIREERECEDTEITIRCKEATPEIYQMLAVLRSFDRKLVGTKDGETFLIDAGDVLFFDSVDKRTFLYTEDKVLETPLRLYELEERLSGGDFFRSSKSTIVNLSRIASLRPQLGGRIEVSLPGGERLYVSRQYVPELKKRLGL